MTEWRELPTFPGYFISDAGQVRHHDRVLKPTPRNGYLRVELSRDGRRVKRPVHVLVLETFVSPRPSPRHHACHVHENDRSDNRLENLAWKLPEDNEADKKKHGTVRGGGAKKRADAARIRAAVAAGESFEKVAKQEGLHPWTVSRIVKGLRRRLA